MPERTMQIEKVKDASLLFRRQKQHAKTMKKQRKRAKGLVNSEKSRNFAPLFGVTAGWRKSLSYVAWERQTIFN